jgi:hypothetical protein
MGLSGMLYSFNPTLSLYYHLFLIFRGIPQIDNEYEIIAQQKTRLVQLL